MNIKSKYKKSSGFVYNKQFYLLRAIFDTKKFTKKFDSLIKNIEDTGYILPAKKSDKSIQTYDTSIIIDELLIKGVNIVELSSNILSDFGIKNSNENYYDYLEGILNKFLYNQSPSFEPYGFPNYKYDNEKNPKELWIQIHPWTTKQTYDRYFPFITILKEKLENSVHKIKPWETFERDLELYRLYLKVKSNIAKGILKKEAIVGGGSIISKSPTIQLLYYSEYETIRKKYPKQIFDDQNLARLISDTEKKLDNVELL